LPGVGQHSGAHTAAPLREDSKEQAEDSDDDGGFGSLIKVAGSESDGGEEYACVDAARPGDELFLQIAAEEGFFAKASGDGEGDPQDLFEWGLRSEETNALLADMEEVRDDAENKQRGDPECQSEADIAEDVHRAVPSGASHFQKRSVVRTNAEKDIARHQPFPHDRANVEEHAVRLRADAHTCREKVEECR